MTWLRGPHRRIRAGAYAGLCCVTMTAIGLASLDTVRDKVAAWIDPAETISSAPSGVRVLRSGMEAEISGPLTATLAAQFLVILEGNGRIRTVQLDSPGGSVDAARALATVITARQLDTYVGDHCRSACVVAFMAGRRRWIGSFAQVSFEARHGRISLDSAYAAAGVSASLRSEIATTPDGEALLVAPEDAVRDGLATDQATSGQFALAGFGPSPGVASIRERLLGIPLYKAVAALDPAGFEEDLAVWVDAVSRGETGTIAFDRMRTRVDAVFRLGLTRASPGLLVDYTRLTIEQIQFVLDRTPDQCAAFARGTEEADDALSSELALKRADLRAKVISESTNLMSTARTDRGMTPRLKAALTQNGSDPVSMAATLETGQPAQLVCPFLITAFSAALMLSGDDEPEAIVGLATLLQRSSAEGDPR